VLRISINRGIHFALVCASIGCPKLQAKAFTSEKLVGQLEQATHTFLSDQSRNRFVKAENTLYLSPIFNWYAEDFERAAGSVAAFIAPYLPVAESLRARVASGKIELEYTDYDWLLNDSSR